MKAYVDADVPLYVCSIYCVDFFPAIPELGIEEGEVRTLEVAEGMFDEWVHRWTEELTVSETWLCLSEGENFRKGLTETYKAARPAKPELFEELKERILLRDNALWIPGLEADDVIGIACTEDPEAVAVSIDKDFRTVPMKYYLPEDQKAYAKGMYEIDEDTANLFWMRQTLTGDSVDGIKGIPKVGPKTAEKLLPGKAPLENLWAAVVRAYAEKGLSRETALLNARLTRILRAGDYDHITKRVNLWDGC